MSLKLFSPPNNPRAFKSLIAARYSGVEIEVPPFTMGVDNKTDEFLQKNPLGKVPVLETPEGCVWESNAIARYVARQSESGSLFGANEYEAGLVEQWIDFSVGEIELPAMVWLYPIFGYLENNPQAVNKAKGDIRKVLGILNSHLETRTFLVGERVTLADIVVICSVLLLFKTVLDKGFRKPFVNVERWFLTCVNQPQFKEVLGEVQLAEKMASAEGGAAPAAEKKQEKPKKGGEKKAKEEKKPKKEAKEEEPKEEAAPAAAPQEQEGVDVGEMAFLEVWKRTYSNSSREVAMSWFWKNWDPSQWSIWRSDYKYNDELKVLFMVSNLVGGFNQRLERLRKTGFGVLLIFGEPGSYAVQGLWLLKTTEGLPVELTECDDHETYTWSKVEDWQDPDRKKWIEDMWEWDAGVTYEGKKFSDNGSVFK